MKSENKFVFLIIFLISVNLIYYKIAKEIQTENLNIIKNYSSLNYQTQSDKNYSSLRNEEIIRVEFRNETNEFYFQLNSKPIKLSINSTVNLPHNPETNFSYENSTGISQEIDPSLNEGLLTVTTSHNHEKINKEPDIMRYYDEQGINPSLHNRESKPRKSHLISFLIIFGILSFITLVLVAMQEYERRSKFDLFNGYSRNVDGYYLLNDRE